MRRSLSILLQTAFGIGIGIAALALAARDARLDRIGELLVEVDGRWLLVSAAGVVLVALAKAARWWLMFGLRPVQPRYAAIFSAMIIGQALNVILPFRAGDFARAHLLRRGAEVGMALGLGTVIAEKLADMLLVGVAALGFSALGEMPGWLGSAITVLVPVALAACGLMAVLLARPGWRAPVERHLPARVVIALNSLLEGWAVLWQPGLRHQLWMASIAVWLLSMGTPAAAALTMGYRLPPDAIVLLLIGLQISFVFPSPPGMVGVVQAVCVLVLPAYGIDTTSAFAYGLLLNGIMVLPLVICGVAVWLLGLSRAPLVAPPPSV